MLTVKLPEIADAASVPANQPSAPFDSKSQLPQKGAPFWVAEHATGRALTQVLEQTLLTQAKVFMLGRLQLKHVPPQFAPSELAAQVDVPHWWKLLLQVNPHWPVELQVAVALAGAEQGVHDVVPQLAGLVFDEHAVPHL